MLLWKLLAIPTKTSCLMNSVNITFLNSTESLILTSQSRKNFFQATRGLTHLVGHIRGQKKCTLKYLTFYLKELMNTI